MVAAQAQTDTRRHPANYGLIRSGLVPTDLGMPHERGRTIKRTRPKEVTPAPAIPRKKWPSSEKLARLPSEKLIGPQSKPDEVAKAVEYALHDGYRHIDAAACHDNECEAGEGVRASGVLHPIQAMEHLSPARERRGRAESDAARPWHRLILHTLSIGPVSFRRPANLLEFSLLNEDGEADISSTCQARIYGRRWSESLRNAKPEPLTVDPFVLPGSAMPSRTEEKYVDFERPDDTTNGQAQLAGAECAIQLTTGLDVSMFGEADKRTPRDVVEAFPKTKSPQKANA
ncbi:hypothetical protein MAPG_04484 [Magnaporthiopsis poae ATCC 64411]|uniref:NADP-dependent oxidoreductase domain-containing protein n=1 Tax=Magnaporthiopsis poae (strain ATCC 64411 / 73-15) TaxID=644358 RepID=A0A0C4DWV1_MAGP6|nr:hypothetical protein MAPG_04484 [Magnaporthiopsis poae ATCC 64411]